MFPTVVFIDIDKKLITAIKAELDTCQLDIDSKTKISDFINYKCVSDNIKKLIDLKDTAFVSAANSIGMLLGGVDHALEQMFPMVQPFINEAIASNKYKNRWGEYFIPVGSSSIVPVCDDIYNTNNHYLISAPTMLDPSNVKDTNNCYHAFYSVLRVVHKFNKYLAKVEKPIISKIVCPGMATGVGGVKPEHAAKQFKNAVVDFIKYDLTKHEIPTNKMLSMFTDISDKDNIFIKDPINMILQQPNWQHFVKFSKKEKQNKSENN